jgi:hypothetical protein
MAFLVLTLSCLPCADDVFATNAGKNKLETIQQATHQDNQDHNDACSPFCYCSCCSGLSINHFPAEASSLVVIDNKIYSSYLPGHLIEYSSPIWQPPQLSL